VTDDGAGPTLGTELLYWIEDDAELVHGSGAVLGQRVRWIPRDGQPGDLERCRLVEKAYELAPSPWCPACGRWVEVPVWDFPWRCPTPKCHEPLAPRRSTMHLKLSRPKGWSKSGFASKIVACEAVGPVLFDGWDAAGQPVGRPHPAPVIRCFATEEGQADNTYAPAAIILGRLAESPLARRDGFTIDVGIKGGQASTRTIITTSYGTLGGVEPRTSSGDSADGGQTTFAPVDETHLWTTARSHQLYNIDVMNVAKSNSPGWVLETTTEYRRNAGSIAELTEAASEAGTPGVVVDHRGFRNMRWLIDPGTREIDRDLFAAEMAHAYGDATWAYDLPSRLAFFQRPDVDLYETVRKFGNLRIDQASRWLDPKAYDACEDDVPADWQPDDGEHVVLGFDGSLTDDHTGLIGLHVPTMRLFVAGHWDPEATDGRIREVDVDATVDEAHARWGITRHYCDPPYWQSWVAAWMNRHNQTRGRAGRPPLRPVREWRTQDAAIITPALRAVRDAITSGQLRHTGHPVLRLHMLNAVLVTDKASIRDKDAFPDGRKWRLAKPGKTRFDASIKIDLAVCAVAAYAAGLDTIAAGETAGRRRSRKVVTF